MQKQKWILATEKDRHVALKSIGVADSMRNPNCEYFAKMNWDELPEEIKEKFAWIAESEIKLSLEEASGFYHNPCSVCGERVKYGNENSPIRSHVLEVDEEDDEYCYPTCNRCYQMQVMKEKGVMK